MNTGVHVSFLIMVFSGYIPRSGIARLDSSSVFSFIMNLPSVFHSDCSNLHSHQLCRRVTFSLHLLQQLLFVDFFTVVILTSVKWYVIVVFNCIYLTIRDVEHFFQCDFWSPYVFFGEKSIKIFCPFFDWDASLILYCMCCLYISEINPLSVILLENTFFHSVGCLFILFVVSLLCKSF